MAEALDRSNCGIVTPDGFEEAGATELAPAFGLRVLKHRFPWLRTCPSGRSAAPGAESGGQPRAVQTLARPPGVIVRTTPIRRSKTGPSKPRPRTRSPLGKGGRCHRCWPIPRSRDWTRSIRNWRNGACALRATPRMVRLIFGWDQPHLSSGAGAGPVDSTTGPVVRLETVQAAGHPTASPARAGHSPGGGASGESVSAGLLVDERQRDRATGLGQHLARGTGRAEPAATMDRKR
jgi:hypothetical protein